MTEGGTGGDGSRQGERGTEEAHPPTSAGRRKREPWAEVPKRYDAIAVGDVLIEARPSTRIGNIAGGGIDWDYAPMTLGDFLRDPVEAQRVLLRIPGFGVRSLAEALAAIDARVAIELAADEERRLPTPDDLRGLRELGPAGIAALLEWGRTLTALSVGLERAALLHLVRTCEGLEAGSPRLEGEGVKTSRATREVAAALMLEDDEAIARRVEGVARATGAALAAVARGARGARGDQRADPAVATRPGSTTIE